MNNNNSNNNNSSSAATATSSRSTMRSTQGRTSVAAVRVLEHNNNKQKQQHPLTIPHPSSFLIPMSLPLQVYQNNMQMNRNSFASPHLFAHNNMQQQQNLIAVKKNVIAGKAQGQRQAMDGIQKSKTAAITIDLTTDESEKYYGYAKNYQGVAVRNDAGIRSTGTGSSAESNHVSTCKSIVNVKSVNPGSSPSESQSTKRIAYGYHKFAFDPIRKDSDDDEAKMHKQNDICNKNVQHRSTGADNKSNRLSEDNEVVKFEFALESSKVNNADIKNIGAAKKDKLIRSVNNSAAVKNGPDERIVVVQLPGNKENKNQSINVTKVNSDLCSKINQTQKKLPELGSNGFDQIPTIKGNVSTLNTDKNKNYAKNQDSASSDKNNTDDGSSSSSCCSSLHIDTVDEALPLHQLLRERYSVEFHQFDDCSNHAIVLLIISGYFELIKGYLTINFPNNDVNDVTQLYIVHLWKLISLRSIRQIKNKYNNKNIMAQFNLLIKILFGNTNYIYV
jgi:hypothetical protein